MIDKDYADKVLKSIKYRLVKYQVINERVNALKLYDKVKPSLNAINKEDIRDDILKRNEKPLADYLKHHEVMMIYLEKDIERVSKAFETISKINSKCATILYMYYFLNKSKTKIAEELNSKSDTIRKSFNKAIELFCKVY